MTLSVLWCVGGAREGLELGPCKPSSTLNPKLSLKLNPKPS